MPRRTVFANTATKNDTEFLFLKASFNETGNGFFPLSGLEETPPLQISHQKMTKNSSS